MQRCLALARTQSPTCQTWPQVNNTNNEKLLKKPPVLPIFQLVRYQRKVSKVCKSSRIRSPGSSLANDEEAASPLVLGLP